MTPCYDVISTCTVRDVTCPPALRGHVCMYERRLPALRGNTWPLLNGSQTAILILCDHVLHLLTISLSGCMKQCLLLNKKNLFLSA